MYTCIRSIRTKSEILHTRAYVQIKRLTRRIKLNKTREGGTSNVQKKKGGYYAAHEITCAEILRCRYTTAGKNNVDIAVTNESK